MLFCRKTHRCRFSDQTMMGAEWSKKTSSERVPCSVKSSQKSAAKLDEKGVPSTGCAAPALVVRPKREPHQAGATAAARTTMSTMATAAGLGVAAGIALGCALHGPKPLVRTLSSGLPQGLRPSPQSPPSSSKARARDEAIAEAIAGLATRKG